MCETQANASHVASCLPALPKPTCALLPCFPCFYHVCPDSLCIGCHLQVLLSVWLTHTEHWCRFLINTFGRELLNEGSGVLDVAGGKGELSFELVNLNGINATVVEPRALQLWRQHKWMLVRPHPLPPLQPQTVAQVHTHAQAQTQAAC